MFPFQQNDELFSQIYSEPYQEDILQLDPTVFGQQPYFTNNFTQQQDHQLENTNPVSVASNNDLNSDQKKLIRKEIERQRRKQMSTLHASIRSLLPLQSIKGKRSMSDHIQEAEKYIKGLQNNVKKLSIKRDKLKNLLDSGSVDEQRTNSSCNNLTTSCTVSVGSHDFGVEVVISCEENFLPSRVVEAVVEEGFDVVSSISIKRDESFYTTLQCKATRFTCVDLSALQQKLNHAIFS